MPTDLPLESASESEPESTPKSTDHVATAASSDSSEATRSADSGAETDIENGAVLIPVRRRPKLAPFLLTGGVLGIIAAAIVANLPSGDGSVGGSYSVLTTFGYFAAIFAVLGVLLGAVVAVLLDRRADR